MPRVPCPMSHLLGRSLALPFLSVASFRFCPIFNLQPVNVLKVLVACDKDETVSQSNCRYPDVVSRNGFAFF